MSTMVWQADDKLTGWKEYRCQMEVILKVNKVPDKAQYAHIINIAGNKAWDHCALNKDKCNK